MTSMYSPFFSITDSEYNEDLNFQEEFDDSPDSYFENRHIGGFDYYALLDIVSAPAYTLEQRRDEISSKAYPVYLQKLFKKLFPTPASFKEKLDSFKMEAFNSLQKLLTCTPEKTEVIEELEYEMRALTEIKETLIKSGENDYSQISIAFIDELLKQCEVIRFDINATTTAAFERRFYENNPGVPSKIDPLAFFRDILRPRDNWEEYVSKNYMEDVDNLEDLLPGQFFREYINMSMLIANQLKEIKEKEKRNEFLKEIVEGLNVLATVAQKHQITNHYKYPLLPFQLLAIEIISKEKDFGKLFTFDTTPEGDIPVIFERTFPRRLIELEFVTPDNERIPLFLKKPTVQEIGNFISGKFSKVNLLDFNTDTDTAYYLLRRLQKHGARFNPSVLERNKQKILIKGKPYSRSYGYRRKNLQKQGVLGNKNFYDTIEQLFMNR